MQAVAMPCAAARHGFIRRKESPFSPFRTETPSQRCLLRPLIGADAPCFLPTNPIQPPPTCSTISWDQFTLKIPSLLTSPRLQATLRLNRFLPTTLSIAISKCERGESRFLSDPSDPTTKLILRHLAVLSQTTFLSSILLCTTQSFSSQPDLTPFSST